MRWNFILSLTLVGCWSTVAQVPVEPDIAPPEVVLSPAQQEQVNEQLLVELNLVQPDTTVVWTLVREQLANESALQLANSGTNRKPAIRNSARDQHRALTGGKTASITLGQQHRPHVVELGETLRLLKVSRSNAKKLIAEGFGPVLECKRDINCDAESPYRTADGSCNNLRNPTWGMEGIPMRRWLRPDYEDGISQPRGSNLPSARLVSRTVHVNSGPSDQNMQFTHMLMQFGQLLDHDLTRTPTQEPRTAYGSGISCCGLSSLRFRPECFPITIPPGDPFFTKTCLDFVRSVQVANARCRPAPVEQLNEITAYIDASAVYGSSQDEQDSLRTFQDGRLLQEGEFLPPGGIECNTDEPPNFCFRAGDERVNENPTLQTAQTIFVREHNRIATRLKELVGTSWDDEMLFQESRKIVGAIMQKITYDEYLPIVLGPNIMDEHDLWLGTGSSYTTKYSPRVDASIRNAFAAAALRMGHSMIRDMLSSFDPDYNSVASDILSDVFMDTDVIISDPIRSVENYARGLVQDCVQNVDKKLTPEVTNNLFRDEAGDSMDLASLNVQRGRDHGIPGYIYWRRFCKAGPLPRRFSQLETTHTPEAIAKLEEVYDNPEDIDLFPGAMSEIPAPGSLLGPTFSCLLGRQFQALRRGDRFFFEDRTANVLFTLDQLQELRKATLSRIICDNTDTITIQKNAFIKDTRVNCDTLPAIDLTKWTDEPGCVWGPWDEWSPCSDGKQKRKRKPISGACRGPRSSRRRC